MDIKRRIRVILMTLLIVNCFAVVLLWFFDISAGAYPGGLFRRYSDETIPIYHFVAELAMAGLTLAGIVGWLRRTKWGMSLTVFGLGMFGYSAISSLGWALVSRPMNAAPMLFTIILVIVAIPILFSERGGFAQLRSNTSAPDAPHSQPSSDS